MDLTFTDEQLAFRDELRDWLQANLPGERPADDAEALRWSIDWQRRLDDGGWAGVHWPKEYGGRGASLMETAIFFEELGRSGGPLPVNTLGLLLAGPTLMVWGDDRQKERHLPTILSAEEIWCQGFSEPNAGSDLAALKTRAVLDGDSFVVNGQKVWTSFARYADWCMLLVRTDPEVPKHKGITFLLVDMHTPGVTVRPLKQISGDEDFNEVFFEDVRVPRANVIGKINAGWDIAITTLMHERQTLTFNRQLQSRVALNQLLAMARRHPTARPAARQPLLRQKLAAAYIDSEAMKYTALRNLTKVLRGGEPGPEGSIEKLFWSEMYQRQLDTACTMIGPHSQLLRDSPHAVDEGRWPHLLLYSKGRTIAAGTSEVQRSIIAERVLGLPRG